MNHREEPPGFQSLMRLAAIAPCLLVFPLIVLALSFMGVAGEYETKAVVVLLYTPWVGFPLSYYLLTARSRWGLRYSYKQESMLIAAAVGNFAVGIVWSYFVYQMTTLASFK